MERNHINKRDIQKRMLSKETYIKKDPYQSKKTHFNHKIPVSIKKDT